MGTAPSARSGFAARPSGGRPLTLATLDNFVLIERPPRRRRTLQATALSTVVGKSSAYRGVDG